MEWPDVTWDQLQLPSFDLPALPSWLPDLPGTAAVWLVLLPLLAAALGITAVGRVNRLAAWVAVGAGLATFAVASWQFLALTRVDGGQTSATLGPLPFGELTVPLELHVDWPLAIVAWTVAAVAVVVQVYARWYLWFDPRYRVFAAVVSLFTAAMLLTVVADDLLLILVGWEVMGWCSYLLVGHHSTKASARRAAGKALLVTRTADIAFVLGLVALAAGAGSTSVDDVVAHWSAGGAGLTTAMVLLVVGVAGKSALFPFQDWLPDAMEGPTPASALIHAATMVAAGTVVLAHLFPLLSLADPARLLLAVLAAVTVIGAAVLAFAQADLKRLLAWSTVSQVALMLGGIASAGPQLGPDAALQHLTAHAWFKALLFLSVGWLGVLVGGTAMAQVVSGVSRYHVLRTRFAVGLLALAGVPPLAGFVTKELVLTTTEVGAASSDLPSLVVFAAVGASVPLTAAYCTRAWLVLARPTPAQVHATDYVQPAVERIDDFFAEPLVVQEAEGLERAEAAISSSARFGTTLLVLMSAVGGVVALLPVWRTGGLHLDLQLLVAALLLMLVAAVVVRLAAQGVRTRDAAARLPARLALAAERGLGFDYLYRLLVAAPLVAAARAVVRYDRDVLDAWVRGAGAGARLLGRAGEVVTPRRATPALGLVLAGVLLLAAAGVVLR